MQQKKTKMIGKSEVSVNSSRFEFPRNQEQLLHAFFLNSYIGHLVLGTKKSRLPGSSICR